MQVLGRQPILVNAGGWHPKFTPHDIFVDLLVAHPGVSHQLLSSLGVDTIGPDHEVEADFMSQQTMLVRALGYVLSFEICSVLV
jgi:hypothetical protein